MWRHEHGKKTTNRQRLSRPPCFHLPMLPSRVVGQAIKYTNGGRGKNPCQSRMHSHIHILSFAALRQGSKASPSILRATQDYACVSFSQSHAHISSYFPFVLGPYFKGGIQWGSESGIDDDRKVPSQRLDNRGHVRGRVKVNGVMMVGWRKRASHAL
jgi:hypothetical protein